MQKSKFWTIIILIVILIFELLGDNFLAYKINHIYLYGLRPGFWILLSFLLAYVLKNDFENRKMKKQIMYYTAIAVLSWVLVYMLSGLIVTYGRNPYNTSLTGIIFNIWIFGTILISKEYVRYKLINNVNEKSKIKFAVAITIVFVVIEIELRNFIGNNILNILRYFMQTIIPIIARNILFTYIAFNKNYLPSMLYIFFTNMFYWTSPVLPNSPWLMSTIVDTTVPIILCLYIRFVKNKLNIFKSRQDLINSDPRGIIGLVAIVILIIWFANGIFPIKPIAIASGSMQDELCIGDIAIIKSCGINDVNVGDIIEYKKDDVKIIHRIIEKKSKNGELFITTKGDANEFPDTDPVKETQLVGKVIFKIKYLGYLSVWLNELMAE